MSLLVKLSVRPCRFGCRQPFESAKIIVTLVLRLDHCNAIEPEISEAKYEIYSRRTRVLVEMLKAGLPRQLNRLF